MTHQNSSEVLRPLTNPPPVQHDPVRFATAKKASAILDRYEWISDGKTYKSRPSARWRANKLISALTTYNLITERKLRTRSWRTADGWRWAVARKKEE